MNKSILFVSIIAATIVTGIIASGELAQAEKPVSLAAAVCPAENVQHWETLAWGSSTLLQHTTLPSVSGGIVKVQADQNAVFDHLGLVASKLNDLGYTNSGNPITRDDVGAAIPQGDSQIICAES